MEGFWVILKEKPLYLIIILCFFLCGNFWCFLTTSLSICFVLGGVVERHLGSFANPEQLAFGGKAWSKSPCLVS